MAIRRLLKDGVFGPEDIDVLTGAFDHCLKRLQLRDRDDPITEFIARKIIELARTGERDPHRLCQDALKAIRS